MTGHGNKFSRKKEQVILALLSQPNHDAAAREAGISARTLARWYKLPEFQEAYRDARRNAFAQSAARLQQASSAAVTTLLKVMVDPGTPAACRMRAAVNVLRLGQRSMETEDLEVSVAKLEQAAEQPKR